MIYTWTDRSQIKKWFVSSAVVVLSYVPWMPTLFSQIIRVNEDFWLPQVTFQSIFNYLAYPFTISYGFIVQLLAIFMLFALSIVAFRYFLENGNDENFYLISGILVFFLTLFAGAIISLIKEPILYDRYLLASISLVMVSISILLGKSRNNKVITIFLALLLLLAAVNVYEDYKIIDCDQDTASIHEEFFAKVNNDDSIFIFDYSIQMLCYGNFVNNADVYCIHENYDDNLHKYIDYEKINSSEIEGIINKNPDKKIYYVTSGSPIGHENHKVIDLFTEISAYSIDKY